MAIKDTADKLNDEQLEKINGGYGQKDCKSDDYLDTEDVSKYINKDLLFFWGSSKNRDSSGGARVRVEKVDFEWGLFRNCCNVIVSPVDDGARVQMERARRDGKAMLYETFYYKIDYAVGTKTYLYELK